MSEFNQWTGLARIATDIEGFATQSGKNYCKFSIAIPRAQKNVPADFIECTAWGKTADFLCKYAQKGDEVLMTARLEQNTWTNKEGQKRSKHILNFCSVKDLRKSKQNRTEYGTGDNTFTELYESDGELPF